MVHELTKAIYQVLINDDTVCDMITTYHGSPAVFTIIPYPENAQRPLIITEGSVRDSARDTKDTIGQSIMRDIRCYTDETGDQSTVEDLGLAVKDLFHRHEEKLSAYMEDYSVVKCWADGPRVSNVHTADEYVYGRIVSLTVWLTRAQGTMEWPLI
jgi:hypothetical protein